MGSVDRPALSGHRKMNKTPRYLGYSEVMAVHRDCIGARVNEDQWLCSQNVDKIIRKTNNYCLWHL